LIEDFPLQNPHIHKNSDRSATIDPSFLASNSKALLAITVALANGVIKFRP